MRASEILWPVIVLVTGAGAMGSLERPSLFILSGAALYWLARRMGAGEDLGEVTLGQIDCLFFGLLLAVYGVYAGLCAGVGPSGLACTGALTALLVVVHRASGARLGRAAWGTILFTWFMVLYAWLHPATNLWHAMMGLQIVR
ncbi:MAG: hypothetical protein HY303_13330 [Candidatus Wallbacteria bacterium]|nr:hypothetical protein [Candidatus Wallbacteria bacterium]